MKKKISALFLAVSMMTAMAIPAMAAEFTPSVEAKPAPEVVTQTDSNGNECAAIIYDANGNEIACVPSGDLIVTPVSADDASSAEIKEKLEAAYEQLQSVSSLTELSADLEKVIKEVSPDLTVDDLVVRDLFDVTVSGTYAEYLSQEGNSITIRFKLSADADSLAAVLHNIEDTIWETVSNDRITRNDDYTADVVFYDLGPVAFLFDAGKLSVDPNAPDSPQTGEPVSYTAVWVIAAAVVVLAAASVVVVKKRSAQKQ
jgi:hypothetical protein